ncbi:MAG TPA: alpha-glucuronidase family glycosyl hydrolase [Steroidobacteraceae bacterium]|jgi:alpha-glucuronidase|nr:alpha-glucuronidase family glycosyl hydrolase [Steroidobacteraceae bacterium]
MSRFTKLFHALGAAIALALPLASAGGQPRVPAADTLPGSRAAGAPADQGYRLWLRYSPIDGDWLRRYRAAATELLGADPTSSPTLRAARAELLRGLTGMLDAAPSVTGEVRRDGAILLGTPRSSALVRSLHLDLRQAGSEGFVIRTVTMHGHRATVIAANRDIGVLYGAFRFLRLLQTHAPIGHLDIAARPKIGRRVLDHWDNLNGTVERGYAGDSVWKWESLPEHLSPRYTDYARACASIGINGAVLNNVNATPFILTPLYLRKVAALASVLRPYGIKVYLSVPFSTPVTLGKLGSADPLDPKVRAWWRAKVAEIYRDIPDFGGLLMKANSEGQPGPEDYGRTQAQGANVLAHALAEHGGIVMWRAFVYTTGIHSEDRARQAYDTFKPLDGKFADNVLVQVKNGPIDFQPREPFHPLFGAMPHTNLMLELQVTKEYLGQRTSIVYLGPLFEEALRDDTWVQGAGSTVARVTDGSLYGERLTAIAGVANVGSERNWCGSVFNQANWYAFGRLAWNPDLSARQIAEEWVRMTFTNDRRFVAPVVQMMMESREAAVDYMTPLGLASQMAAGTHLGPGPWVAPAKGMPPDWSSTYYSRADASGIGFDRTATGSNAVAQYSPHVAAQLGNAASCPENLLLWFHHLSWDYRLHSGQTLWDSLVLHYDRGVESVKQARKTWDTLAPYVDSQRYNLTADFLAIQEKRAEWWRNASIAYFQSISHRPLPAGAAPPTDTLAHYEAFCVPYVEGSPGRSPACAPADVPVPR